MLLTCADLEYIQGTLPAVSETIEDLIERLHKIFKRATGKPFPGIEVSHDVIREQGFNGSLYIREFGVQCKGHALVPQEKSRYLHVLPGVVG